MTTILVNNVNGNKVTESLNFVLKQCCNCGIPFFMTEQLNKHCRNDEKKYFYCPNGHAQHYSKSDYQEKIEKLERELNEEKRAFTNMTNAMLDEKSKAKKLKTQLNRVHKGVCPCCNRTFINLQRHMATKHPETVKK